ncbi:ABC transporter permease/substrate-binding protein [Dolosicoccus paucivorans]|uniref:Glycine/betaine ABC transporter permease n=1 Tax=Dolosicoccus paucivorans TaxID=84521 RepID=A0A1G8MNE3_9LACT|nr:ABC transporter permease/substrate-binding protein [Dolosicoccus paucivorans]PMB85140.1 glycine/betaine ABC transporter permease [Dolosicoccus paucivorans]PMC58942.1 glycine/betaine ABC transporter permease [Dolosicoccus paucivorans]SDI69539.1 osmoprotectant transport system permease protein [Dolosicoccus paucivorans]
MQSIIQTFQDRQAQWFQALIEHIQISLTALFIAMLIAIPFAILIVNHKKLSEGILQISGVTQTIPSLALLGLLIPVFGIGKLPAVIVLVVYALFPILQNTLTGLQEIDPMLQEAATAFGMNRLEKLKKYELPLAMPMIIAGIRTSSVLIIGTATLAALIGAGGLGSFILLGIDRNNTALILIGAISSAILAVLINFLIKKLEGTSMKTIVMAFSGIALLLATTFVKPHMTPSNTITIAGKLGAEPEIIINMYKLLIEEETDLKVELKPNMGKTTFLYEALKQGSIDIYPEFSGTIVQTLLNQPPQSLSQSPEEVYQLAKDEIFKQDQLVYLEPMEYQNTYALAVPESFASKHHLEKISDLTRIQSLLKAGVTLEFNDREDGSKGILNRYGLDLKAVTMEPALRYQAINNGEINVTDVYSTDSQILVYHLTLLEDDQNLFPPYQGAPLLRKETADRHPELVDALTLLAHKISTQDMIQMNYEVDVNEKSPASVAKAYLIEQGLLLE